MGIGRRAAPDGQDAPARRSPVGRGGAHTRHGGTGLASEAGVGLALLCVLPRRQQRGQHAAGAGVRRDAVVQHEDELVEARQARAQLVQDVDGEVCGDVVGGWGRRQVATTIDICKDGLAQSDATHARELGRVRQHEQGAHLGVGGHVAIAGAEEEDVAAGVEEDMARLAADAEHEGIAAQRLGAGLVAGVQVGRDRRRGGAPARG